MFDAIAFSFGLPVRFSLGSSARISPTLFAWKYFFLPFA